MKTMLNWLGGFAVGGAFALWVNGSNSALIVPMLLVAATLSLCEKTNFFGMRV